MKKPLTLTILCALAGLAYAGTENYSSNKEVMQQAPPSCDWYRAHEWNLDVWGMYAFSFNSGINDRRLTGDFEGAPEDTGMDPNQIIDLGVYRNDRFLNRDGAWGGGADVKFFFNKYWALGVNGFVVDANDNSAGGGTATVTIRFPIGCSRFAPYIFGGFGFAGGGSNSHWVFTEIHHGTGLSETEREDVKGRTVQNKHYEILGQGGIGIEYRVTRHIGVMADFVYNALEEGNNDFGMGRFGVTLSY